MYLRNAHQGSRLAVSQYPRDTRFQIWILDIIGLVSRRDTKKISKILTKNANIYEVQTLQRSVRQNNIFSLYVARKQNRPEHEWMFLVMIARSITND